MAECHAALIGGVFGCTGPLLSHGLGRAAGWSPDNTGQRVILRQPVGPPCLLIALFGALASSATAAFAALAAQSSLFGAGAGAAAQLKTHLILWDMKELKTCSSILASLLFFLFLLKYN
eukprot:g8567.t1